MQTRYATGQEKKVRVGSWRWVGEAELALGEEVEKGRQEAGQEALTACFPKRPQRWTQQH